MATGDNLIFSHLHASYYLFDTLYEVTASYLSLASHEKRQYLIFYGWWVENVFACEVSLSKDLADEVKRFHFELSSGLECGLDDLLC